MGRPRALVYENLHLYDKLHTKVVKMYSGLELTCLYLIKETAQFFVSTEVWASCSSKFRVKKPFTLSVNIPIVEDQKAIDFLNKHCWKDYLQKHSEDSKLKEAIGYLDRLFPDKEKKYFYEFNSLIHNYLCGGLTGKDLRNQKYYNGKYNKYIDAPELLEKRRKWTDEKDEKLRQKYCREYIDAEEEYAFIHCNVIDTLINISKNSVCFPVGFEEETAKWYQEKYGKKCSYTHVGEIYFVVTPKAIFFNINRHY